MWYEEKPTYVRDYTMDGRVSVAYAPRAYRELAEVGCGQGTCLVVETEDDTASGLVVDCDVKLVEKVRCTFADTHTSDGRRT